MWKRLGVAMAIATGSTWPAFGQNLIEADAQLRRQAELLDDVRARNNPQPSALSQSEHLAQSDKLPDESPCVTVKQVMVRGFQHERYLAAVSGQGPSDPPQGKCLGAKGIQILLGRVQNALVADGFITARVLAPDQDLNTGSLILHIQEGRVARIHATSAGVATQLGSSSLAVQEGKVLNLRDIEQTLENWRRLPNAAPTIQIEPGAQPGESDLNIKVQPSRPFRVQIGLDDAGDRSTGRLQGSLTLHWDNPTQRADAIYWHTTRDLGDRAQGPRGQKNHVVQYSVPLGYWAISGTASWGNYHQQVVGAFQDYTYRGQNQYAELRVDRVIHRAASAKTAMSLQLFARRSSNHIDDTEVLVQRRRTAGLELGVQHQRYLGNASVAVDYSYKRGTGAFGSIPAPEEMFGEGTSRMRLSKLDMTVQYALPFLHHKGTAPTISSTFRRQWAHSPLSPPDRFCFGGRYTVRGFDGEASMCGESGWLIRNELSLPAPDAPIQVYVGVDGGHARGMSAGPSSWLLGAVAGVRGYLRSASPGRVQFDAFVAKPLHQPRWFPSSDLTTGVSLQADF